MLTKAVLRALLVALRKHSGRTQAAFGAYEQIEKAHSVDELTRIVRAVDGETEMRNVPFGSVEEARQYAKWLVISRLALVHRETRKAITRPGRATNRIAAAFESITTTPVPVEEVIKRFGVARTSLYQSARLDKTGRGKIRIANGMIWREPK